MYLQEYATAFYPTFKATSNSSTYHPEQIQSLRAFMTVVLFDMIFIQFRSLIIEVSSFEIEYVLLVLAIQYKICQKLLVIT